MVEQEARKMTQGTFSKDQLWAELEALGEAKVRERLVTKAYGDVGHKRALVEEWLRLKDQARSEAVTREQIDIARAAANAARDSADEARKANTNARIASAIATIAAIVSIIALFRK